FLPVEDERLRHDDERRPPHAFLPASLEQREHLDRLAEAHVVGETAAETELAQELEPAEPLLLIAAQLAAKAARRCGRAHAAEARKLAARLLERRVERGLGLGREQGVEQAGLTAREPQVLALDASEPREQ